ncbi:hypothetical protein [Actinoplanes solisilvae]|uniref:hypothetical protein n=1 Tax=Actinoplanes solisilvae TaxID=2486853 RepID=UPI000FD7AE26|nr:hypothetical protein [Actinoplanes solisilvae]
MFDRPATRRDWALTASEPTVTWFTEVTRPAAAEGRRIVNELYQWFPDVSGRLRADLRSTDNRRLLSALDELYVHEQLRQRYHLAYEEGVKTRPDFRLYSGPEYVGTVEVLTLFERDDWGKEARRNAWLEDEINRLVPLTTHSLSFDVHRWDSTPNVKHLTRWLRSILEALRQDPDHLDHDATGTPERVYVGRSTDIAFQFYPLRRDRRPADGGASVIGGPVTGGFIDAAIRLRDRLDVKAGKYELDDKPFALVVGIRDSWCSVEEVHEALVGTPAVVIATGQATRRGDGFFGVGRKHPSGKRTQVSSVFSLHEWFPGGPYQPRTTRFDNPFAAHGFPLDALAFQGHWGVRHRNDKRVLADWLSQPTAMIAA